MNYRTRAFMAGLERCGFRVTDDPGGPAPGDVLVIWNRRERNEKHARTFERAGAAVIVCENGWIGGDGKGQKLFAMCLGHHNGAGTWAVGEGDRWARLGIDLLPWRAEGDRILVLLQRGIGEPGVAMPHEWRHDIERRLRKVTKRPVVVRDHPGMHNPDSDPDWRNVHAVVTWASGAAIKAIAAGVPVFYDLPQWIGAGAARFGIADLEDPFLGDRLPMFQRLAWAQWSVDEIAEGAPFRCLLRL